MTLSTHQVLGRGLGGNRQLVGIGYGLAGGLVGTFLMDAVMIAIFVIVGQPADMFFRSVGERLGGGAPLGIAVHDLIGTTGGFAFSLLVLNVGTINLTSIRRGLMIGVAAGAITIPLGCIPMAVWLGASIVEVVGFSILPHLVWGAFVGWTVAFGLIRLSKREEQPTPEGAF